MDSVLIKDRHSGARAERASPESITTTGGMDSRNDEGSVQLLDRHRDTLANAHAHGGGRAFSAALLHAVHRRHRQPGAAHPERMPERDRAAVRIDEIGILLQ